MDKPASSDTENGASRDMEDSSLIRGYTHGALGETEVGFLAEAFRERPRARRRFRQGVETSCARPKARRRASGLGRGR